MDDIAFDRIARLFGATPTRRGALGLIAGALGALSSAYVGAGAKSKNKKKGKCPKKKCPKGFQRNKRTCECECTRHSAVAAWSSTSKRAAARARAA